MALPNVFLSDTTGILIDRINKLQPNNQPIWGKMSVDQMLAHCNVTYEMIYTEKHPKPNFLLKAILKIFIKNTVVNETPYKKNSPTASQFLISDQRNFEDEKMRLVNYINEVAKEGEESFNGRESNSFGKLTTTEWNNMLYKHLDHHLNQFGV